VLKKNVDGLASVTSTIVGEKRALTEFLDVAPLALLNLQAAFDPKSNSLGTRGNFDFATNPGKEVTDFVCTSLAAKAPAIASQCNDLTDLLDTLPINGANTSGGANTLGDLLGVRK
jgi:phospholipid/cholesterol/gamma-HCH transport system substrate-binding protein